MVDNVSYGTKIVPFSLVVEYQFLKQETKTGDELRHETVRFHRIEALS